VESGRSNWTAAIQFTVTPYFVHNTVSWGAVIRLVGPGWLADQCLTSRVTHSRMTLDFAMYLR